MPEDFIAKQSTLGRIQSSTQGGVFLFYASLVVAVFVLLTWGGLLVYRQTLRKNIENWKIRVEQLESELRPDLINQLLALSRRLGSAREVLTNHSFSSRVFDLLEKDTHPQVDFSSFQFSAESRKVDLTARAANYRVVAEQVAFFEADPQIESVDFAGLHLDGRGAIAFRLTIKFKPSLLRLRTIQ